MSIDPESGAEIPEDMVSPFPDPGETAKDLDAQAASRLAMQYADKPRAVATIALFAEAAQGIEDCLASIPELDDPAVATGVNLDVTGELVGQGRVLSDGTVSSDAFYRTLIAQRILYNRAKATSPEYIAALDALVFPGDFRFYDLGHMTVGIEVEGEPNSNQKALINNGPMPKAAGVGIVKVWFDGANYFAFDEDVDAGASGFGEIGDAGQGGKFAELF